MKITKLEYQKRDRNLVDVYVDNQFIAAIDANDVLKLNLFVNKEITPEDLNKIITDSKFGKLFNSALNFLSFRPRSEWEIRDFFRRKLKIAQNARPKNSEAAKEASGNKETVEKVIEKLKQIGQINDDAFAQWLIDQRRTFKPMGQRALKYELLKKGLARQVIDTVLSDTSNSEGNSPSEVALALKALSKKSERIVKGATDAKSKHQAKVKLQQFLIGRGFGYDTAREAVEKLLKKEYNRE